MKRIDLIPMEKAIEKMRQVIGDVISRATYYNLAKRGELKCVRVGNKLFMRPADIDIFLSNIIESTNLVDSEKVPS